MDIIGKIWSAPTASVSGSFSNFGLSASLSGGISGGYSGAFSKFTANDAVGTPLCKMGTRYGPMGSDTTRFIETVYTLSSSFGDMSGLNVVEFGSNYGGLAFCVHQFLPSIGTYYCLDLPEVQALSNVFFSQVSGGIDTSSISYADPSGSTIDVFISEYSLTEFDDDHLYPYFYTYCVPATTGFFIRSNFKDPVRYAKFITTASLYFTCSVEDEPKYRLPNKILIGKK
jgi:hypothetical protein